MSYTIEYSSEVYKVPPDGGLDENHYLLVITQGDNNVYEASGRGRGRRARSRYIISYGWNYSTIQKVCERAGYCEGGGLQPGNHWISPEAYLQRYRDKIKNAPPIEKFFEQNNKARFELRIDPESEYQKELLEKHKEYIHEETGYYSKEKELWAEIHLNDMESFKKFSELWSYARFHNEINIGEA